MKELTYSVTPERWDMDSGYGNHRIIISAKAGDYARVEIPWRRRDLAPNSNGLIIRYGQRKNGVGEHEIKDIIIEECRREYGVVVFRAPVDGTYELYYMPYKMPKEWHSPNVKYYTPEDMTPNEQWVNNYDPQLATEADALGYECRTEFDSFYPMEVPMTKAEHADFVNNGKPFFAIAESRLSPVRMKHEFPYIWTKRDKSTFLTLCDEVYSNEHYAFQIVVYSNTDLDDIRVAFTDKNGSPLPEGACICFNTDGVDTAGKPMTIKRDIARGYVLPLWCGVKAELFEGSLIDIVATVSTANTDHTEAVSVSLARKDEEIIRNGDDDLWRMSRLFWLNSDIGTGEDVIAPYTPVKVSEDCVNILGRSIRTGALGLPKAITSFFDDGCQLCDEPFELLSAPIALTISKDGINESITSSPASWSSKGTMEYTASTDASTDGLNITSSVRYDADGHIDCMMNITATKSGDYSFVLNVPMRHRAAPFMMGMCREGGQPPSQLVYRWDCGRDGNEAWFGGARVGLQVKLMQENEHWRGSRPHPRLWANGGKGYSMVKKDINNDLITFSAHTEDFHFDCGQTEILHFHMIVTPFHPIDYERHWTKHYYHKNSWNSTEPIPSLENAKKFGTHTVILHQGGPLNENINYPFVVAPKLKTEVDRAHSMGLKYKIYYTVRELSNYTKELWALLALGDEIFRTDENYHIADFFERENKITSPKGGPWLREHLVEGFAPAWHQFLQDGEYDCAIATQSRSRWHNYYLQGLDWLIRVVGIDGLYLDGMGYDRHIMRRIRRVMNAAKPDCDIDIHNGNEHSPYYKYDISNCIYMEHFPYANSLWNGEGFDCENSSADNFFTEMCGIPFGLMGEMLEKGGNPHRGMIFGMTARCGWSQGGVSVPIWKVWDDFGIKDSKMLGYWHPDCPVSSDNDFVYVTVYQKDNGDALVCVANWFPYYDREFTLSVNRKALGITGDFEFYAPAIEGVQEEATYQPSDMIPLPIRKGLIMYIRRK